MSENNDSRGFKMTTHMNEPPLPFSHLQTRTSQQAQTQTPNFSFFQAISQRPKTNVGEAQPNQHHRRIFPPVNYSTPQRPKKRIERGSPSEFQDRLADGVHGPEASIQPRSEDQIQPVPQFRFLPTPKTVERFTSSRSPSEARSSYSVADPEEDLSTIVNRKLNEAKIAKAQLDDERMANANLRSEITTLKASSDDQKRRIAELEADAETERDNINSKEEQLHQLQHALDDVQSERDSQLAVIGKKDDEILAGQQKINELEENLTEADARIARVKVKAKAGFEVMSKNFDSLKKSVEHMKTRYEVAYESIPKMRDEVESLQQISSNGFKELEPYMDASGRYLFKVSETRELIEELQGERHSAQQVVQFLRDKLHDLSTQLAEANEKVAEVESRRKEEADKLSRSVDLLQTAGKKSRDIAFGSYSLSFLYGVGQRVEVVASRLSQREQEDAELLTEGLKLENQLTDANERISALSDRLGQRETEVERLKEEKQSLTAELQAQTSSLDIASDRIKGLTEENTAYQQKMQSLNHEFSTTAEKLRATEEAKGVLQTSARKDAAKISELEDNLRLSQAGVTNASSRVEEAFEKVKILETERTQLKREYNAAEEESRKIGTRLTLLQERFDSQTMTLQLAKEHSGDLQERLLLSEKAHATKLESTHGQYKTDLAVLDEQRTNLQNVVGRLRDDIRMFESSIEKLREERTVLQGSLERYRNENSRLENSAEAQAAENSTLRERVAVLQDQTFEVARLRDEITAQQGLISRQVSEIAVLHSERAKLEEDAAELREEQKVFRMEGARLKDDVTAQQGVMSRQTLEIAVLRSEKAKLEGDADELREEQQTLKMEGARLKDNITAQQGVVSKQTSEIAVLYLEKANLERDTAELKVTIEDYRQKLIKQVEEAAQKSSEALLKELTREFKKSIGNMEVQLEAARLGGGGLEKDATEAHHSGKVEELEKEITRLREIGARLKEREMNLEMRYREGDLSDSEKSFVDFLIKLSQEMHEQEMVTKENELRRRENMNCVLQQKVDKLESTLAKVLKGHGNDNVAVPGPKEKSMLDLELFMLSPLTDHEETVPNEVPFELATTTATTVAVPARLPLPSRDAPPRAKAARVVLLSPAPNLMREERIAGRAAKRARGNNSSSPAKVSIPTFAKLDEEDISDFEDEVSLATSSARLGKRHRLVSPLSAATTAIDKGAQDVQGSRPARRSRYGAKKGSDENQMPSYEKKADGNVSGSKLKSRKRR
ncbi:hypothetical protein D9757_006702 [Collybiopsis confluens]|uniref:Uncharacterized protein n=1 Tax=Collybiopsis confluens TaxID=2823264 RepID=A0A8H5MAC1_9AGAR|nr:hypothetical protein D9757_006702 [Collybiopsis confluens]